MAWTDFIMGFGAGVVFSVGYFIYIGRKVHKRYVQQRDRDWEALERRMNKDPDPINVEGIISNLEHQKN